MGTPNWVSLPIQSPADGAIVLLDGTTRELGKENTMTTSMRTFRNAVLLAAGVMLAMVLVYQSQASAILRDEVDTGTDPTGTSGTSADDKPYVVGMSPKFGATGVPRNTNITVNFDRPMAAASVNESTFLLYRSDNSQLIPATVSMAPTEPLGIEYVLDPYGSGPGRLDPSTEYRVEVTTGVHDTRSRYMSRSTTWHFTTAALTVPYMTQVSPQDGATGVSRSTNIKVTFSEEMDPATINTSTFQLHFYDVLCDRATATCSLYSYQVPATVSKDPTDATGRTWVLDPYGATSLTLLSANRRYRVTLTTGVRDLGDLYPISSNKVWYFKTGSY